MAAHRRLAGGEIAGDDDEPLALRQAIAQIGHRLAVRPAFKIESGIGRQLERASGEAIELIVHRTLPWGSGAAGVAQADERRADKKAVATVLVTGVDRSRCVAGEVATTAPRRGGRTRWRRESKEER